jgi:hypothetical protein
MNFQPDKPLSYLIFLVLSASFLFLIHSNTRSKMYCYILIIAQMLVYGNPSLWFAVLATLCLLFIALFLRFKT